MINAIIHILSYGYDCHILFQKPFHVRELPGQLPISKHLINSMDSPTAITPRDDCRNANGTPTNHQNVGTKNILKNEEGMLSGAPRYGICLPNKYTTSRLRYKGTLPLSIMGDLFYEAGKSERYLRRIP